MEIVKFIYNGTEVDFQPTGNDNVMVNATQMAKIFGKRIDFFLKSDHTNEFIRVLEFPPNGVNSSPLKRNEIIQTKGQAGTWMHRILALKFAAWLDPAFELWIFLTIDQIILGHYREQKEATAEKLRAEKEVEIKRQELLEKYPEFIDFLALESKVMDAEKRRQKAIRESVKQLRLDLFPESQQ